MGEQQQAAARKPEAGGRSTVQDTVSGRSVLPVSSWPTCCRTTGKISRRARADHHRRRAGAQRGTRRVLRLVQLGVSMGGTRALCLATIDVREGNMRDLRHTRAYGELEVALTPELSDVERAQEHSLRLRATTTVGRPPSDA